MTAEPIVTSEDLTISFGGIVALDGVNLDIKRHSITAIIGPNGAGKTTFFNCLTGIYTPTSGKIFYHDPAAPGTRVALNGQSPNEVTKLGLARTFQNIRLFANLTVLENVLVARHCRMKAGILGAILRDRKTREEEKEAMAHSYRLLKKYGLAHLVNAIAKNLPYGAQRRLEIIRALGTGPSLLLLDEPAAGLNIGETKALDDLIRRIRDEEDLTVLLIEHDMSLVMSISETIHVMDYGRIIASGPPEEIKANSKVVKAYLGEEI